MKRIAIDVDGIAADFTRGFRDVIVRTSKRNLFTEEDIVDPPVWDFDYHVGYTKEEHRAAWGRIVTSPTFWYALPPLPGAEALQERMPAILLTHDVYFVTNRAGFNAKAQTEAWLQDYVIPGGLPTVLRTQDQSGTAKGLICKALRINAFLDDKLENVEAVVEHSPETTVYLLDYRYNQLGENPSAERVQASTQYTRVNSVAEFLRLEQL